MNINVGMEIQPDTMPADHSKYEKMVQRVALGQTGLQKDTLEVNVIGADQNTYKLAFLKPGTQEYWQSGEISAGGDAA